MKIVKNMLEIAKNVQELLKTSKNRTNLNKTKTKQNPQNLSCPNTLKWNLGGNSVREV